jgi:hypothetical protein
VRRQAMSHEPLGRSHDLHFAHAIGRGQHDPGAPNMLLQTVAAINDRPAVAYDQLGSDGRQHQCAACVQSAREKAVGQRWQLV